MSEAEVAVAEASEVDPLFSAITINGAIARNRFVLPAMQRASFGFRPTERMVELLRGAAEGGTGMIISEGSSPDHPAAYWQQIFSVIGDDTIADWRRVANAVLSTDDVLFLMQLWHPGALRLVTPEMHNPYPDYPSLSPSGLVQEGRPNGVAMSAQDLDETKKAYVKAALIAQELGAHGIEVHSCHGYLLDLFLWHETNKRMDDYGGTTLTERAAYPAEIVAAIREATGPDFVISFRFSQWKEVDYAAKIARHPDELGPFLERIERAGANLFNVSTRRFDAPAWPELDPRRSLASWVKGMTRVPVVAIGSVGLSTDWARDMLDDQEPRLQIEDDLVRVRRGLEAGDFDLIAAGRAQVANPQLVNRVRDGALSELRSFQKSRELAGMDEFFVVEGQLVHESHKTEWSEGADGVSR
jgi:2,4-dienoyl-CoA reductase-like NADH-dependent reductase (Old Yellow Enzyme family)